MYRKQVLKYRKEKRFHLRKAVFESIKQALCESDKNIFMNFDASSFIRPFYI